jgi:hypothetical protein
MERLLKETLRKEERCPRNEKESLKEPGSFVIGS